MTWHDRQNVRVLERSQCSAKAIHAVSDGRRKSATKASILPARWRVSSGRKNKMRTKSPVTVKRKRNSGRGLIAPLLLLLGGLLRLEPGRERLQLLVRALVRLRVLLAFQRHFLGEELGNPIGVLIESHTREVRRLGLGLLGFLFG